MFPPSVLSSEAVDRDIIFTRLDTQLALERCSAGLGSSLRLVVWRRIDAVLSKLLVVNMKHYTRHREMVGG